MKTKSFTDAFASVFDIKPSRRAAPVLNEHYFVPSSGPDTEAMQKDFRAVGDDMRMALRQYGQKPQ